MQVLVRGFSPMTRAGCDWGMCPERAKRILLERKQDPLVGRNCAAVVHTDAVSRPLIPSGTVTAERRLPPNSRAQRTKTASIGVTAQDAAQNTRDTYDTTIGTNNSNQKDAHQRGCSTPKRN